MRFALMLPIFLALTACGQSEGPLDEDGAQTTPGSGSAFSTFSGETVAQVHGSPVAEDVLLAFMRLRNQTGEDPAQRQQALSQLTDLYLLAHDAERNGLLGRRAIAAELEVQRLSWIANKALAEHARVNPVTDEEILSEYQAGLALTGGNEYLLHHILVDEAERAVALIARLDGGETFAQLAQSLVAELGASNAGSLGWVNAAQIPAPLAQALDSLAIGAHAKQPVQTDYGWHILYLEDSRALDPPSLDAVRATIQTNIGRQRWDSYLQRLRGEAGVDAPES